MVAVVAVVYVLYTDVSSLSVWSDGVDSHEDNFNVIVSLMEFVGVNVSDF